MPLPAGVSGLNEVRASAALPAAGAWDASPTEFFVSGASWLGVHLTYTEGEPGGSVDVQLELSPYALTANVPGGAQEWIPQTLYAPGVVAGGVDTQSLAQNEYVTFDPTGVTTEAITFAPVALRGVFERARVRARETSQQAVPGTCQISATLFNGEMFGVQ